ncbi:GNAT family N-acetyltransferase [Psychrobacillus psychrodurans]|uniref:GNAT family N-acetyltransferase n=1 Tax=Psychrobacillus psychrodurans TaxID=126157 RepID=A0A9X3R9G2_9BACI|nr:GNAT family N-acetyltransferase [Psychrobacillus psychrodurans]MCZ8532202.1 GNAT family N-acetyltransferase [Psychrobacillus psychrodurans]
MNISVMAVSFPLDQETMKEIKQLIAEAETADKVDYITLLSVVELSDFNTKGFCLIAYDDDSDRLVGVLTSIDRIATLDFEWSGVVLPSARRLGIGERLVKELGRNLETRGAATDFALIPDISLAGQELLHKFGYTFDFQERTMAAEAVIEELDSEVEVSRYTNEESEVVRVLVNAFGDNEEEAKSLIDFNTQTPNRQLMIAKLCDELVGTFTLVEDGDKLWVTGLAVHENARGKGVATNLLNWAKCEANRMGKVSVYLDVETDNNQALSIYKKVGFTTESNTYFYKKS